MTPEFLMLTTTVAGDHEATALARALVEARLAACVQVLPTTSTYRWQDAVETACEHLLICKIRTTDFAAVETMIRAKHVYEVPEVVAIPIAAGSQDYLGWLADATER